MNTLDIVTAWAGGSSNRDPWHPKAADDFTLTTWGLTTQGPAGGVGTYTMRARCDDTTAAQIESDPNYNGKVTVVS